MSSALERLPSGARVAVIRLRSLGDCVLTTPALHILKTARPDVEIGVVVEDRFAPVYAGNPDVARVIEPSASAIRSWAPQLCLNLHGGTRSAALTVASMARLRAGFAHYRNRWAYNIRIPTTQEILGVDRKVHTAEHLASAIFCLGAPQQEPPRARLFASAPRSGHYSVIHPFASSPRKTWPAGRFAEVARSLTNPVFIGAASDDITPFDGFETLTGAPLGTIKDLLAGASLFVGNDSGPAHMAAAFGVPVVILFGDSDFDVWRPWKTANECFTGRPIADWSAIQLLEAIERLKAPA